MRDTSLEDQLRPFLSDWRFEHSKRVADLAVSLASHHRLPEKSAYLAGLFHDIAKDQSPDTLRDMGIPETELKRDLYDEFPPIWHSFVAPVVMKTQLEINDTSALDASVWHSTGRSEMTPLDQLIFIADFCEPGRQLADADYIRDIAYESLIDATYAVSSRSLLFMVKRSAKIHPLSFECWEWATAMVGSIAAVNITTSILELQSF